MKKKERDKMMKKILVTMISVVFVMIMTMMPVFAASSNYGFELPPLSRVVDGCDNGVFHPLDNGGVKITGSIYIASKLPGALAPETIHISLYNKTTGNYFGQVTVTPYSQTYKVKNFSGTFNSVGGGTKYYLRAYRAVEDGNEVHCNGTLKNV